jgi:ParB family chromosome partitioning protein
MSQAPTVTEIPVQQVRPGANDRTSFDEAGISDLAASIEVHGLAQPITVRPHGDGFEIVAGERRFRAVKHLGRTTVPAIVRDYTDEQASAVMLLENVQRADLDPVDEAHAYQSRIDRFGLTVGQVAEMAGVTAARVCTRLPVLRLFPEAQHLVRVG